jgi:hypothetical protein
LEWTECARRYISKILCKSGLAQKTTGQIEQFPSRTMYGMQQGAYLNVGEVFPEAVGQLALLHGGDVKMVAHVLDPFHRTHDAGRPSPKHLLHLMCASS